ncbi:MAG TPA: ribokinase [Leptolyngbyaceae cyanobacterium M33_DOE_097]|uniref:Ribokinase n=1 Tax=Oscillatoriales cyanobacterium SpSt-418 TaxID=2282169 RepID=A0A7C3KE70_9CYAN|nr:ribokinase [Leptolyngbyaceae cyanobacterium M33_DOE_097]
MPILVFGSLNMDLVAHTPRLPQPGETILGSSFLTTPGGKGANQAVAAAKLGIPTQMVGRVGNDSFGQELLAALQAVGIETQGVLVDSEIHSGVAIITVSDRGENEIIGVFGANGRVDATDVERLQPLLSGVDALMLQFEIPLVAIQAAAQTAHNAGVKVLFDPAPVQTRDLADLYPFVDYLLPNEIEAAQLVGFTVHDPETAQQAAIALQQQGVNTVVIKLGAKGAFCLSPEESFFVPAFKVEAIDTVAAGDAFAGGFAAAIVEGRSLREAVTWGNAAGALAATKRGAQAAMSDRATFDTFLQNFQQQEL